MQNDTIFLEPVAHVLHQQYEIHLKENIHKMWTHTRSTGLCWTSLLFRHVTQYCIGILLEGSIIELLLLLTPFIMYLRGGQMSH